MINKNTKDSLKNAVEDDQKLISLGNIEKTKEIFKRNCKLLKSIIKNEGWQFVCMCIVIFLCL